MGVEMTREGVIVGDGPMPEIGVAIYVRKPREGSRTLSFPFPTKDMYLQSLMARDVLNMGLAYDGDNILIEVTPKTKTSTWVPNAGMPEENAAETYRSSFYEGDVESSLSQALNNVQRELADWLIRVGAKANYKVNVYFV